MSIKVIIQVFIEAFNAFKLCFFSSRRDKYGYIDPSAIVMQPCFNSNKKNTFLFDHSNIGAYSKIISKDGKFYLGSYSDASFGFTVITDNHKFCNVGDYRGKDSWMKDQIVGDVIVEDYCWIGANVTLCPGVHVGRGCLVAAGSVCVKSHQYPPYTIIGGNPAIVIKSRFTLEEQLEHERMIIPEGKRYSKEYLEDQLNKTLEILSRKRIL